MCEQVWGVGLGLWEFHVGDGRVGEAWAYPTSQLQLIGFALVLLGTIIYAQVQCPHPLALIGSCRTELPLKLSAAGVS